MDPQENVIFLMTACFALRDHAVKAPDEASRKAVLLAANMLESVAAVLKGSGDETETQSQQALQEAPEAREQPSDSAGQSAVEAIGH
jgi:hypothetical protein